jgi:hypothetical protein
MGQLLPHCTCTIVHCTCSQVYCNHTANGAVSYKTHSTTSTHRFIPYSPPYNLAKVCACQLMCNVHFVRFQGCLGQGGTYYEWCTCKPSCQGLVLHAGCQTVVGDLCHVSRACTPVVCLVPMPALCLHPWHASCVCTCIVHLMPAPVLCVSCLHPCHASCACACVMSAPVVCISHTHTHVGCLVPTPALCILCPRCVSRACNLCCVSHAHACIECLVPAAVLCISGPHPLCLSVSACTLVCPHPCSLVPVSAIVVCILVISM